MATVSTRDTRTADARTYTVRAVRWDGGWELHIQDIGVTQVRTLAHADAQARDYLKSLLGIDTTCIDVVIVPDLGGLEDEAREIRHELDDAAAALLRAAEHSRRIVRALRDKGLSVTDTAAVLGVTRGRISQLMKDTA
jgi:DNA-directed RNA polymerase specialized sigma subunit